MPDNDIYSGASKNSALLTLNQLGGVDIYQKLEIELKNLMNTVSRLQSMTTANAEVLNEGFKYVQQIRDVLKSYEATEDKDDNVVKVISDVASSQQELLEKIQRNRAESNGVRASGPEPEPEPERESPRFG